MGRGEVRLDGGCRSWPAREIEERRADKAEERERDGKPLVEDERGSRCPARGTFPVLAGDRRRRGRDEE